MDSISKSDLYRAVKVILPNLSTGYLNELSDVINTLLALRSIYPDHSLKPKDRNPK